MIYLKLFWAFFKVGLFAFGGGYAMIPLIRQEIVVLNNWLTIDEFFEIVTIAEMTPGPIAINSATFVGYRIAGVFGALVATTSVILPTIILVILLMRLVKRFKDHVVIKGIIQGIRPIIPVLVLSAAIFLVPEAAGSYRNMAIIVATFAAATFTKINPILLILAGGILGIIMGLF